MKTATNPIGQTVYFDEKDHRYFVGDTVLTPVTTFVDGFFPKFLSEDVATKYAKKHGLKKDDVLAGWERERDDAGDLGNAVHAYAELEVKKKVGSWFEYSGLPEPPKKYENSYRLVDQALAALKRRFAFIDAEKIIFSVELGFAGTIDLVVKDTSTGDIVLFDWKTNKEIRKKNDWWIQMALDPVSHLEDCNWNKYRLQLNTYKFILEKEGYFSETRIRMGLIHVRDKITWHKVGDMTDEIRAMIDWV